MTHRLLVCILGVLSADLAVAVEVGPGLAYTTIQEGIDATPDGGQVDVQGGVYFESISLVDRVLVLEGRGGSGVVTIESPGGGRTNVIEIVQSTVTMEGFTVNAAGERRGLSVQSSEVDLLDLVVVGGVNADGFPGGGLAVWNGSSVAVWNSAFLDNSAYLVGVPSGGHVSVELNSNFATDLSVSFEGGGAGRGGALFIDGSSTAEVSDAAFIGNQTSGIGDNDGGAICSEEGSILIIHDSHFEGNVSAPDVLSAGGAVYGSNVKVYGSQFIDNGGAHRGAALAVDDGELLVSDSAFVANVAVVGGAIYCRSALVCDVLTSRFEDNVAWRGGAVLFSDSEGRLQGNAFCRNRVPAPYGGPDFGDGGAVLMSFSSVSGTNNVFYENSAHEDGGAVASYQSDVDFTNNHFLSNLAVRGGAIHHEPVVGPGTLMSVNDLFAWNSDSIADLVGNAENTYSLFYLNGGVDPVGPTDITGLDPLLVGPIVGDCDEHGFYPTITSPLIGAGDPGLRNPDDSLADIGAFGGPTAPPGPFEDVDGDGAIAMFDCDDRDVMLTEPLTPLYPDGDGDAYGDFWADVTYGCVSPGFVDNDEDCDDLDVYVYEGPVWYADVDGDGLGSPADAMHACVAPPGWVSDATDCNDGDADILEATPWYADVDGDGLGDASTEVFACLPSSGQVDNGDDCDDSEAGVGAPASLYPDEDLDGFGAESGLVGLGCPTMGWSSTNNDCDDLDPLVNPETIWYRDADADEIGGPVFMVQCERIQGHVLVGGDCNDGNGAIGAPLDLYVDMDLDGFGGVEIRLACPAPGLSGQAGDCNDGDASVHPGAAEFCDDVDSDCDGDLSDPESADAEIVHRDDDGDGYGNPSTATLGCVSTTWLVDGTDCDDGDRATHPGAPEVWYDGIDQNCDGLSDFDQDRDGYDTREEPGSGEDCDDLDPNVNPSVRDQPDDGIDENCDGVVASTWILGGVRGCQTGPSAPLGLWGLGLLLAWRRRQVR